MGEQKKRFNQNDIALIAVVIFVAAWWVWPSRSPAEPAQSESRDRKTEAWVMCQQFVEARLKSPASAEFPWGSAPYVTRLPDDRYRARAYVDAQNSFGAMLRNDFNCVVEWTGERWELESLTLTPQ